MQRSPILIVHGGAWAMPDDMTEANEQGVFDALQAGWALLEKGATAIEAVEAAVTQLENDATFDAGYGSFLTRDGRVQMDALLMDGATLRAGGVACVERLRNPIRAARLVLDESPHIYFVGQGAEEFAAAHGMPLIDNAELIVDRERRRLAEAQERERAGLPDLTFSGALSRDDKSPETAVEPESNLGRAAGTPPEGQDPNARNLDSHDTVGAVALDVDGNIAAATSTGGTLAKAPGRVGDSSLIGCGCYADNQSAAVSLTGWGEPIMKLVLGKWATDRVQMGRPPEQVAQEAISYLYQRLGGHGGMILLDAQGRWGIAHNTPRMAWGVHTVDGPRVGVKA